VVTGGAFPAPNSSASGFFFRVFENNASITLRVFDETTNPQIAAEDALEGVEEFTLSVIANEAYTIDPVAAAVSFTILDNPDSVPLPSDNGDDDEPGLPSDNYNPQVVGSGDGVQLIPEGISPGSYTLELTVLSGL
jgi:hypothetical protein